MMMMMMMMMMIMSINGRFFSLRGPPSIKNSSPNCNLGTPIFEAQKRLFRVSPTFFRFEVSPYQIMAS